MYGQKYTALLGGSFNPPHIGHLRIAQEVMEACQPEKLLFVPCSHPPHKPLNTLLPYEMRAAMLNACIPTCSAMAVSSVEHSRPGPSYTVDTLLEYKLLGYSRLLFIMGVSDLLTLPSWKRWQELTDLADIILFSRACSQTENVSELLKSVWPEVTLSKKMADNGTIFSLPSGGSIRYIPQPVLEISSSLIRERWLAGRSISWFVPHEVQCFLEEQADKIRSFWSVR